MRKYWPFQRTETGVFILASTLALASFAIYIRLFFSYPIDDAYIHLRIARNFVEHGQPFFNSGEKVMGSASHLWVNLAALLISLEPKHLEYLRYPIFLFCSGTYFCCVSLLRWKFSPLKAAVIACALIHFVSLSSSTGMMEVSLAMLLYFGCLVCYTKKQWLAVGFLSSLAIWTRPEFSIFFVTILFYAKDRSAQKKILLGFFPAATLYLFYVFYYFGTIIPFPAISKQHVFKTTALSNFGNGAGATVLEINWISRLLTMIGVNFHGWNNFFSMTVFLFFAGYLLWRSMQNGIASWVRVTVISSLLLQLLYTGRGTTIFPWYVPLYLLPLGLASFLLLEKKFLLTYLLAGSLCYPVPVEIGLRNIYALITTKVYLQENYRLGGRVQQYLKIGEMLQQKMPNATVMTPEIGGLGWAFHGKIIDSAALVSPDFLKYYLNQTAKQAIERFFVRIPLAAIQEFNPDMIVGLNVWTTEVANAIKTGQLRGYHLVKSYPIVPPEQLRVGESVTFWGSSSIEVYAKNGTLL